MTLKERLDAVWNDERIASPCHINIWSETKVGYDRYWHDYGLCWKHGKLLGPRKGKIRKGFSFLPKLYQVAWRYRNETPQTPT